MDTKEVNKSGPKDKFLDMMYSLMHRWKDVTQKVHVLDQDLHAKPEFISISLLEREHKNIKIINGSLVEAPKNSGSNDRGYMVNILMGDKKQGCGDFIVAREGLPNSVTSIRNMMDEAMNFGLKGALHAYFQEISTTPMIKNEKGLMKLSKDPIAVYIEKKPKNDTVKADIVSELLKWTSEMSKLEYILESEANINTILITRRFIDSEERKIKTYSRRRNIYIENSILHSSGFHTSYSDRFILTNGTNFENIDLLAKLEEVQKNSDGLKTAKIPISDQYPIIFDGKSIGVLLHEALAGHLLSGKYISQGVSTTFKHKLNKKILPEFITLIDDPQKKDASGYFKYDDEGIEGKRIILVENGHLRNYLLDRASANYFQTKSNGHARSQWVMGVDDDGDYRPVSPEPRTGNLEVISTNSVEDEKLMDMLMKHCKDHNIESGIYIQGGSGFVEVESGSFRLSSDLAWKIFPDGKKERITSFYVLGNPYELLTQIVATGKKMDTYHGMCGADSGYIPTEIIAPSAFIPRVTIQSEDPQKNTDRLLAKEYK